MPVILTIDDKEDNLISISALLKSMIPGCSVLRASSGRQGIIKARSEHPDTILLDINMPEMDGFEVCRILKSDQTTKHIPVIILTAINTDSASRVRGLETGADAFLAKPVDRFELSAQVKAMLRIKYAEDILKNESKHLEKKVAESTAELVKKQEQLIAEIDERKLTETDLREKENRFRSLIGSAPDGIVIADQNGHITMWNNGAGIIFGFEAHEIVGKPVTNLMPSAFHQRHMEGLNRIISTGKGRHTGKTLELEGIRKNGSLFPLELSLSSWQSRKNWFFAAIIRDITDRKKAETEKHILELQLQQTTKLEAVGLLAGGIAHDFNNILFPIIGHTEMSLDDTPEGSVLHDSLSEILKASLRAGDLVKQILTFSNQTEKDLQHIKPDTIISEVLKLMRSSLPTTIMIEQDIDPGCSAILVDPTHIQQIAMNLITNAFHAMEENGGTLKIVLKQLSLKESQQYSLTTGPFIHFSVSDTGTGISRKILDRIFDPYYTTKKEGKGTGLGLSVVHGIVKSYEGEIRVESTPGHGTVFDIFLPITNGIDVTETEQVKRPPIKGGNEHIIIVDDETSVLRMEKQILERLGYRITALEESQKALDLFRSSPDKFDILITDMTMPGMTGDKLALKFKEIRQNFPVILCTGYSEKITEENASELGIDGFLMKPVIKSELTYQIRRLLNNPKGGQTP